GGSRLVAGGVGKGALLPTQFGPLGADGAVHLVSPRLRRPVDRATLEVVATADAVLRPPLVGGGVAQEAVLPAHAGPFIADGAVDFVGPRLRRPEIGRALCRASAADAVLRPPLSGGGVAQQAQIPLHAGGIGQDRAANFVLA